MDKTIKLLPEAFEKITNYYLQNGSGFEQEQIEETLEFISKAKGKDLIFRQSENKDFLDVKLYQNDKYFTFPEICFDSESLDINDIESNIESEKITSNPIKNMYSKHKNIGLGLLIIGAFSLFSLTEKEDLTTGQAFNLTNKNTETLQSARLEATKKIQKLNERKATLKDEKDSETKKYNDYVFILNAELTQIETDIKKELIILNN